MKLPCVIHQNDCECTNDAVVAAVLRSQRMLALLISDDGALLEISAGLRAVDHGRLTKLLGEHVGQPMTGSDPSPWILFAGGNQIILVSPSLARTVWDNQPATLVIFEDVDRRQDHAAQDDGERAEQVHRLRKLSFDLMRREKRRLAAILHGDTVQTAASMALDLELYARQPGVDDPDGVLKELVQTAQSHAVDVRRLMNELAGPSYRQSYAGDSFTSLLQQTAERLSLSLTLHLTGIEHLDERTGMLLLFAAQEMLQNAKEHGHATHTRIRLLVHQPPSPNGQTPQHIAILQVADNGQGFKGQPHDANPANDAEARGYGLRWLREELIAHDGQLTLRTLPPFGTAVRVQTRLKTSI